MAADFGARIPVAALLTAGVENGRFLPGNGKTESFRDLPDGPEMVVVPAGHFAMGAADHDAEEPVHPVTIHVPFAVGRLAVTFAEWDAGVSAGGIDYKPTDAGYSTRKGVWGRGRQPVIHVSWHDAHSYVSWLAQVTGKPYRLLSEAEWEYCCRAGTTTRYAFGEYVTQALAHFATTQTSEVGSYPANAWGIHDMHGNVWEWVEDTWHADYVGAPGDGSAWQGGDPSRRIVRGGSYKDHLTGNLRSAARISQPPDFRSSYVGFRVARSL
jgi:formylglycine-generating enzyme required for sulfatase activity